MNTDPIADYLTRVRNAIRANHKVVSIPASNLKKEITKMAGFFLDGGLHGDLRFGSFCRIHT